MRFTQTKHFSSTETAFALIIKEASTADFKRLMRLFPIGPLCVVLDSFLADQCVNLIYKEQDVLNLAITKCRSKWQQWHSTYTHYSFDLKYNICKSAPNLHILIQFCGKTNFWIFFHCSAVISNLQKINSWQIRVLPVSLISNWMMLSSGLHCTLIFSCTKQCHTNRVSISNWMNKLLDTPLRQDNYQEIGFRLKPGWSKQSSKTMH